MTIKNITEEQKADLNFYQNKWLKNKLYSVEIDHNKTSHLVRQIYNLANIKYPNVILYDGPCKLLESILTFSDVQLGSGLARHIEKITFLTLQKQVKCQLSEDTWRYLWFEVYAKLETILVDNIENILWDFVEKKTENSLGELKAEQLSALLWVEKKLEPKNNLEPEYEYIYNCLSSNVWSSCGSYLDFCISVLKCNYSFELWEIFKILSINCGWIFPYEKVCFVSAPPKYIRLNEKQLLHADSLPAVEFSDGFSLLANHGLILDYV